MRKIGMVKGINLCRQYKKMDIENRQLLQSNRLHDMVKWAKENSPYFKELYQYIDEDFSLEDLPVTDKKQLMLHFDDWITDPTVKLSEVEHFMQNQDNIGRKFLGKYMVFTTSGSTGEPLVALCDNTTNNIMSAINITRTFARKEDMNNFILRGGKTIGVFATEGFYLGNSSVRARQLMMPWKKRQIAVTSALKPIDKIVEELNNFQPDMLGGYPSNLELLIDEQKNHRLHIHPVLIMTGGEYLSENLRKSLSEAFHCFVQTSYSCTEGGTIACECTENHFHINDDWLIVEAVDKDNRPVPDGVKADKILLTNLFNFTQPFIRYEVTDRVVMHHEPCSCGNASPWLTLEGRTDDIVCIKEGDKEVRIPPLAIYATLKEIHEIRRFQLVASDGNKLELRLESSEGVNKEYAFIKAKDVLLLFLTQYGVKDIEIVMSEVPPTQHTKSGKFKHIINTRRQ